MNRKASDSTLEQKLFMSPSATISQVATRLLGFHSFQYLNGPMTLQKKIDHEFMGTFGREFWAILRWKTAPNERNFLNWLKTHTKVINA